MNQLFLVAALAAVTLGNIIPESRILGGNDANPGEFPYQVSLQYWNKTTSTFKHFCGGSIVDSTHVVTAAHCLSNVTGITLQVVAGAYDISKQEASQQVAGIANITNHPNYTSGGRPGPYDIAVLTLASALTLNSNVAAIALPAKNVTFGQLCTVTGWGNTKRFISSFQYVPSPTLKKLTEMVMVGSACQAAYLGLFPVQMSTGICGKAISLLPIPTGSCQGDSGGPFACKNADGNPTLTGIVSWGLAVCGFTFDIYTDVAQFNDFITSTIAASSAANGTTTAVAP